MYLRLRSNKSGRRFNKRFIIFLSAVAFVILAIVGIIVLVSSGRDLKDDIQKTVFDPQATIITQKNGIIYTDNDNLIYLDYHLKEIWNKKMFAQDVKKTASDKIIAVFNTKNVQLFNMDGAPLFTKELTGTIIDVRCGSDKAAVITEVQSEEEGVKKYLTVFNIKGEIIDTINFEKQNIIDIGFYGKTSKLWVLTLDTEGIVPISRISTYEPGQSMTGIININGQLVEKLIIDESSIYASGTTNLNIYSIFGEKKDSLLIYGWNFAGQYFVDNKSVFLYVPRIKTNKSFDSLRLIKTDDSDLTINLPPGVIRATIYNDKIYCFSKTDIFKYSLTGKREDQYKLPYAIDGVSKIYDKYAFLIKGSDEFILTMP